MNRRPPRPNLLCGGPKTKPPAQRRPLRKSSNSAVCCPGTFLGISRRRGSEPPQHSVHQLQQVPSWCGHPREKVSNAEEMHDAVCPSGSEARRFLKACKTNGVLDPTPGRAGWYSTSSESPVTEAQTEAWTGRTASRPWSPICILLMVCPRAYNVHQLFNVHSTRSR